MSVTVAEIDPRKISMELCRQGIGRGDLCKLTGISESNFSGMMRRGRVRSTTVYKIAEALGVDAADIIKAPGEEAKKIAEP